MAAIYCCYRLRSAASPVVYPLRPRASEGDLFSCPFASTVAAASHYDSTSTISHTSALARPQIIVVVVESIFFSLYNGRQALPVAARSAKAEPSEIKFPGLCFPRPPSSRVNNRPRLRQPEVGGWWSVVELGSEQVVVVVVVW